ncbi:MAG: hypothetical protein IJN76_04600 [Clostridia bacterium]|nr:hypothetical protein [Clostridia bacterium]
MKKLLAVLLSVLMLVSCCVMSVAAGDEVFNDGTLSWNDNFGDIFNDAELDWGALCCQFLVGSAEAKAGDTIVVPVSITNNPGIVSMKMTISYDESVLELLDAAAGDFVVEEQENVTVASPSFGPIGGGIFTINWIDALATENNTQTGVVANLTFKIKEDATGSTPIYITFNENDIFDKDYNNIPFNGTEGVITIIEEPAYIPGDVDGNGTVNVRDLGRLQQYLNGFDVTIDERAANVTGDSSINVRDYGLLQQYLNGWDVVLK